MKTKLLFLAMLIPSLANAQVLLEQTQAESGSYYKGVLIVTEGCNGAATTRITVDIPEGLQFAQPMPKAGWQLEIVKKPVQRPFFRDGIEITEAVRQITWSGNSLHDIHFDEFIFRGRIGVGATSKLYFPVNQKCESGELFWDQIAETQPLTTATQQAEPTSVIELMEDMEEMDHDQHQHGQVNDESEHSGDHSQPEAHQHDHQMHMDEAVDHDMDHAGHAEPEQVPLQYPAPFVIVVDGTGEHHH